MRNALPAGAAPVLGGVVERPAVEAVAFAPPIDALDLGVTAGANDDAEAAEERL